VHPKKAQGRSGSRTPLVLNLDTKWNSLVSFTLLLLYPKLNIPLCTLSRRLSGPWRWSGFFGVEKDALPKPGIESLYRSECSIVAILTTCFECRSELLRLYIPYQSKAPINLEIKRLTWWNKAGLFKLTPVYYGIWIYIYIYISLSTRPRMRTHFEVDETRKCDINIYLRYVQDYFRCLPYSLNWLFPLGFRTKVL